ncbi:MobF family relaxase [uncultured Jatrophihabitans sp.]|uniref:MobF family relaxase n=1 Tax=uncultured Jatrophihabitans sp. TaxID=1610747 RepID=UPI0035C9A6A9
MEADRGRADDYYLAEGTGIAERFRTSHVGQVTCEVPMTGDNYEAWVAGFDPQTGEPKGRLRNDANAVRFVEVVVNGPKTWSLAAELHPDISAAYDAAQDAAAQQIVAWLAQHATTRVGPRGAQLQVPVTELDAVTVRHYTSRAGDPHRHLHLQINARVLAEGSWRGLHTVGVRDSIEAINGLGHAAVMTDPGFRDALAAHGFTLDADTGEITQLAECVGPFSARAAQIGRHLDTYETAWRAANPGQEPGPALRRSWDRRAWAQARPDKVVPADGQELTTRWVGELHALGYRHQLKPAAVDASPVGRIDRDAAVEEVLARLAARRSGWNAADIRGQVETLIGRSNVVVDPAVRAELAEDVTARTLAVCVPLLHRNGVPEHIRALTSRQVLAVEADLTTRLAARANVVLVGTDGSAPEQHNVPEHVQAGLDAGQREVVTAVVSGRRLLVVEGAAGAGKTTMLAAARTVLEQSGTRLRVVTPTRKAARVAAEQVGSDASSAAWLAYQHGYRWDQNGVWTRLAAGDLDSDAGAVYVGPKPSAVLAAGDVLLVDEAGMLDQDTARAVFTIADEHDARLVLFGDRHQLPAVGRGGVLDLAARWAGPDACLTLETVHRFTRADTDIDGVEQVVPDEQYAHLSLAMRTGTDPDTVFDALLNRGQIAVHATEPERLAALATDTAEAHAAGGAPLVIADTHEQVAALNHAIRDALITIGQVDDTRTGTIAGSSVGVGDRVVTRRNDTTLDVANRDTWTVTAVHRDGALTVTGEHSTRVLPADYARKFIELGYATTVHGVQGDTARTAHLVVGEHTSAASAYVGMTRGRTANTAHLVADNLDDAREQWLAVFARDRADLGPAHAAELAAAEAARYAEPRPLDHVIAELRDAWTREQDATELIRDLEPRLVRMDMLAALRAHADAVLPVLADADRAARAAAVQAAELLRHTENVAAHDVERLREALLDTWDNQRGAATAAGATITAKPARLGHRRAQQAAINEARAALEQWADTWRTYVDLPTDLDALARAASRPDNRAALWEQLDYQARQHVERAHPEYSHDRSAAEHARAVATQAHTAHRDTARDINLRLQRLGPARHTPHPFEAAAELRRALIAAQARHNQAQTDVAALTSEPALRARPADRVINERARWHHDRDAARAEAARQQAAARAATARVETRAGAGVSSPTPHHQPQPRQPDQGRGYGR